MLLDKSYLEKSILECKKTQERLRLDFERQEGVIKFCEFTLKRMEADEKETEKAPLLNQ